MRRLRSWLMAAGVGAIAALAVHAQNGSVRVITARANIRADASETSPVLTQVMSGTVLELLAAEGDWFHVRLPPDPRLGGARVDAYISKKVAKLDAAAAVPTSPAAGSPGATPTSPAAGALTSRDGMSVALIESNGTTSLAPGVARVIQVRDKLDSIAKLAASMTSTTPAPAASDGSAPVTYVWLVDGPAASKVLTDRRPSFIVQFKEVPGVGPDDLAAAIVKLTPSASQAPPAGPAGQAPPAGQAGRARIIAAARGRADQASRQEADWDFSKDLKQDLVRTDMQLIARGTARVQPSEELAPGEYAVVVRLAGSKKKLAGATFLASQGEGRAFGVVWDFSVK